MLSNGAVAAIFGAPTGVIWGGTVAVAIGTDTTSAIGMISVIVLGLGALCFVFAQSVTMKHAREHEPTFQALAAALGGAVVGNILGDRMVRAPHPRGRLELEYCAYSFDGESHEPFTRVALVLPAGSLPRVRRDMLLKPRSEKKLGPATRAEVAAAGPGKVRLLGRGSEPSVELWVRGWLSEREALPVIERARPHLEALASRPWTA